MGTAKDEKQVRLVDGAVVFRADDRGIVLWDMSTGAEVDVTEYVEKLVSRVIKTVREADDTAGKTITDLTHQLAQVTKLCSTLTSKLSAFTSAFDMPAVWHLDPADVDHAVNHMGNKYREVIQFKERFEGLFTDPAEPLENAFGVCELAQGRFVIPDTRPGNGGITREHAVQLAAFLVVYADEDLQLFPELFARARAATLT